MAEDTGPLVGSVDSRRIAAALTRLESHRRNRRNLAGLSSAEMRLLWLMVQSGPQTLTEVTDALGLERSTVNRQVNAAVDDGLLNKSRVPGSAAIRVELSDSGREAYVRGARASLAVVDEALADLGESDSARLLDLIERFADAYGRRVTDG